MKPHEIFFVLSGLFILSFVYWIEGAGYYPWISAKFLYFTGIVFFTIDTWRQAKLNKNV
jgi:hypothetical protein